MIAALAVALAAAGATAPAVEQAVPAAPATAERRAGLSASELFSVAQQAEADRRVDDALAIYRALERDPNEDVHAEALFRAGLLLAENKRYAAAAVSFRKVLDVHPEAQRVRLELARVLALMGEADAARRTLRQAQAGGLPPDVADTVGRFARALRTSRPLGGSLQLAVAPDSNVNRATQARTLDTVIAPLTLSRDARAQSGVGLRIGGSGFVRVPLSDRVSLLPRVATLANIYGDHRFNDVSGSVLIGLEWRRGGDRWSPAVGLTQRWYGDRSYARTATAALDWLHPIGRTSQLIVHGGAARTAYRRNDLQDGGLYDVSVAYEHAIGVRAGVGVSLSGYRQVARDPGYSTRSVQVGASGWRDLGRFTVFSNAAIARLTGDARLFLFADPRREWLASGAVGVTARQLALHGFAPQLRATVERNWSTVGLYRYRRATAELGVVRAF